jgi:SAM-dependent methyltransferase
MAYLNPRPDQDSIGRFYPDNYECYKAPAADRTGWWGRLRTPLERLVRSRYQGNPRPLRHWYERLIALLANRFLRPNRDSLTAIPFHGEGRLLDFGCGSGWYAERMRRRGWAVSGLDFNPYAALQVKRRFGIPVFVGSLPHPDVKPESFDVITMGSVLEHVHHPQQVVAAAARVLRPEGLLVILVPNLDSWGFRHFGSDWYALDLPRHLLHFTPATLRRLVEICDLEVIELRMLGRTSWMRRSLARAAGRQVSLTHRLLTACRRLPIIPSLLTRWTVWRKQADCILLIARRPKDQALTAFSPSLSHAA